MDRIIIFGIISGIVALSLIIVFSNYWNSNDVVEPTWEEYVAVARSVDFDRDGIVNAYDNCPGLMNPDQNDSDNDGFGDVCENPPPPDDTPPVIEAIISPKPGTNGWYTSDVTVRWLFSDPESGIATSSMACVEAITLTNDTSGTTITCSVINGARLSASKSVTIKIDKSHGGT